MKNDNKMVQHLKFCLPMDIQYCGKRKESDNSDLMQLGFSFSDYICFDQHCNIFMAWKFGPVLNQLFRCWEMMMKRLGMGQFKIWPLKLCNRPAALFTLFKPADQHSNFSSFQLFTQLDNLRIYLEMIHTLHHISSGLSLKVSNLKHIKANILKIGCNFDNSWFWRWQMSQWEEDKILRKFK